MVPGHHPAVFSVRYRCVSLCFTAERVCIAALG